MLKQIAKLDLDPTDWQVIDAPAKVEQLRRVNIISYARLRMCLRAKAGRKTYAAALRRRIGVLVADEGDLLANADSLQSRALWQVSARRVFPFSGTPIANLPKDALPLLAFAGGDGTSAQPYGYHRAYLSKVLRQSCIAAERGLSYFREQHVVTEWITNEFSETLRGARREIPAIANLPAYRAALAPHMTWRGSSTFPNRRGRCIFSTGTMVTSVITWPSRRNSAPGTRARTATYPTLSCCWRASTRSGSRPACHQWPRPGPAGRSAQRPASSGGSRPGSSSAYAPASVAWCSPTIPARSTGSQAWWSATALQR
jgi:hypothetical protein